MKVDVEKLSWELTKEWWFSVYIVGKDSSEYEEVDFEYSHGIHITTKVKDEEAVIFWNKVEDYKQLIEKYKI